MAAIAARRRRREQLRSGERPAGAVGHHPAVGAEQVDDPRTLAAHVGDGALEQQCEREGERRGDDGDDEASTPPLQVAQADQPHGGQHAPPLPRLTGVMSDRRGGAGTTSPDRGYDLAPRPASAVQSRGRDVTVRVWGRSERRRRRRARRILRPSVRVGRRCEGRVTAVWLAVRSRLRSGWRSAARAGPPRRPRRRHRHGRAERRTAHGHRARPVPPLHDRQLGRRLHHATDGQPGLPRRPRRRGRPSPARGAAPRRHPRPAGGGVGRPHDAGDHGHGAARRGRAGT